MAAEGITAKSSTCAPCLRGIRRGGGERRDDRPDAVRPGAAPHRRHRRRGGGGVAERCGYALQAPPRRIAATDAPWPQFAIERHALIGAVDIAEAIRRLVAA